MTTRTAATSPLVYARVAGILYVIITIAAPFSMLYVPSALVVPGNAAATANNVMASEGMFRLSIASDSIVFLIEIALLVVLYVLLKPAGRTLSLIAASSRLAMTVVQAINLVNYFFVLLLVSGADYLTAFEPDQLHALVLLFFNAHEYVALIWTSFFGLHLVVLGYLVYRSGFLPRFLGVLLVLVSVGYLVPYFGTILSPQNEAILEWVTMVAYFELVFPLWLLIKGVNVEQWQRRALESA